MLPVRRNLKFNLPLDKITRWHPSRNAVHFFNTLSVVFPVGERFFIDSVRQFRDNGIVSDEKLLEAIRAFIGQEAMHGREHEAYNAAYEAAGFGADQLETFVAQLLELIKRGPPEFRLAATIALEHYTAILANALLTHPELIDGAEPRYHAIWNWHALEETEHKAVAFDVFRKAYAGRALRGYLLRTSTMALATLILWSIIMPVYVRNVARDGLALDWREWRKGLSLLLGRRGVLRLSLRDYLDFYRPGFHPWDHDNRHLLQKVDALAEEFAA